MITKSTPLSIIQEIGKECTQCGHCCSTGSGFAIQEDMAKIADYLGISSQELQETYFDRVEQFHMTLPKPKLRQYPYGACVFLKDKKCTIHPVKPLQCKTGNLFSSSSQLRAWFALNYQVNTSDPESIRQWASYIQHGGTTIPGGELNNLISDANQLRRILNHEV